MPHTGEVFWEVGMQLPQDDWNKTWKKNECVASPMFTMPDVCTLQIFFYPAGLWNTDAPSFKLVRTDTTLRSRRVKGTIQLCHGITLAAKFRLDHGFERGRSEMAHAFERFSTLRQLQIFHSLSALSYRFMYTVEDPDPNETEPEPSEIITS